MRAITQSREDVSARQGGKTIGIGLADQAVALESHYLD